MSHDVLLYYRGIVQTIPSDQLLFVRIRRNRYEVARSFEERFDVKSRCPQDTFGLCPYELANSVILKPPSLDNWLSLSAFQRALWYIDEVEARWLRLKFAYPKVLKFAIEWEKSKDGSFESAVEQLQNLILGSCEHPRIPKDQKQHVMPVEDPAEFLRISKHLDRRYKQIMNYSILERKLIKHYTNL